jgi:hypothetical protein
VGGAGEGGRPVSGEGEGRSGREERYREARAEGGRSGETGERRKERAEGRGERRPARGGWERGEHVAEKRVMNGHRGAHESGERAEI